MSDVLTPEQIRAIVRDEIRLQREQEIDAAEGDDSWMVSPHHLTPASFTVHDIERFWEKVDKNGPIPEARPDLGPCWLWLAAVDADDGGRFRWGRHALQAYRAGYVLETGNDLSGDLTIDHLCLVRRCVRGSHLEPVPMLTNVRRASKTPTAINRMREVCENGHPFDDANTLHYMQNGRRVRKCRACARRMYEDRRAAQRAAPRLPKPSREVLEREIASAPFTALAVKYGCSDTAIKKWARGYGIPLPARRRANGEA